jgi:hypothetical protein
MTTMKLTALVLIGQMAWTGPALGDEMSSATGDENGAAVTMMDGTGGSGTTTMETGGTSEVGAAESLSPGNRKIADSLFDSQTIGSSGQQAWSLDQIAAAKQSGQGWGEIFHQMKADGLIQAKNLGQVVSGRYRPPATGSGSTTVVITNGAGATAAVADVGGRGRAHGSDGKGPGSDRVSGAAHGHGNGHAELEGGVGVTTAGGNAAVAGAVHAGGNRYGHYESAGNSTLAGGAGAARAGEGASATGAAHGVGYGHLK